MAPPYGRAIWILAVCIALVGAAVTSLDDEGLELDPYLEYRPEFARSLPVQILLNGIVLALTSVLFIYLIFTAQYHWPLAQVNYILQLSGVTTLLISLIASLHVVFQTSIAESKAWPYMLNYVAVQVPPAGTEEDEGWSTTEKIMWYLSQTSTSTLVQLTHIQFLTLLYPSRLEGRLIIFMLGPLSAVSAIMQLIPISTERTVNFYASAIRNVCNATLSLLFTAFLFIWGLLINRKQAWRTDGGTAAFGVSALLLALVSTALNLLYIPREEEFVWLPALIWATTLWQSFLGWWWWVGAGSGDGVNGRDIARREEERERRQQERGVKRRQTREKAKSVWRGVSTAWSTSNRAGASSRNGPLETASSSPPLSPSHPPAVRRRPSRRTGTGTQTATGTGTTSDYESDASTFLPHFLPAFVHRWYADIRHEHRAAAREQAAERAERIREIVRDSNIALPTGNGWGLGSFGWRTRDPPPPRRSRRRGRSEPVSEDDEEGYEMQESATRRGKNRRRRAVTPEDEDGEEEDEDEEIVEEPRIRGARDEDATSIPSTVPDPTSPSVSRRQRSMWWSGPLERWRHQDSTAYN